MWSLTQAEIQRSDTDFIHRAFGAGWDVATAQGGKVEIDPILRGGLPGVLGVLDPSGSAFDSGQWEREIATLCGRSAALIGSLFETQVAHDLLALADAGKHRVVVRHWRDNRRQLEVDLSLVHPDGTYLPVEVKAASSVNPRDTKGLVAFAQSVGSRCSRAVLIYTGDRLLDLTPSGSRAEITAVPFSLL